MGVSERVDHGKSWLHLFAEVETCQSQITAQTVVKAQARKISDSFDAGVS